MADLWINLRNMIDTFEKWNVIIFENWKINLLNN